MDQAERDHEIGSAGWLQERFPDKDWHRHRRTDGRCDICDGTPSDCSSKPRLSLEAVAGPRHVEDVPVSASEPNPPKAGR